MKMAVIVAGMIALAGIAQSAAAADGKEVFEKSCMGCHKAMDPKVGDKKAWEPRIKKGTDALVASVVKGMGAMPPKGGAASLSNVDIKAAVEYMVQLSK
jgi:cytochrome c5